MSINIIGLNLEKFCYKKHTQIKKNSQCVLAYFYAPFVELCSKLLRVLLWSLLSLLFPFLINNKNNKKEFNIFIQIILMIFINFDPKPPFVMCVIQLQGYIFMAFLGAKKGK